MLDNKTAGDVLMVVAVLAVQLTRMSNWLVLESVIGEKAAES
jgi:hypothetical protein